MKRKVTWWQGLLLVIIVVTGIYFAFSSIVDTEQNEINREPGDIFAGTKVARVGVLFRFTENHKMYQDPKLDRHWTTVVQVLDRHGLIERGLAPEVMRDTRRNNDLSVRVDGTLTSDRATWRTTFIIQRELSVTEGGHFFNPRIVKVAQVLESGGSVPRAELEMAVVKDLERLTEALARHLTTLPDEPRPRDLHPYSADLGPWNLVRYLKSPDGGPKGAELNSRQRKP